MRERKFPGNTSHEEIQISEKSPTQTRTKFPRVKAGPQIQVTQINPNPQGLQVRVSLNKIISTTGQIKINSTPSQESAPTPNL